MLPMSLGLYGWQNELLDGEGGFLDAYNDHLVKGELFVLPNEDGVSLVDKILFTPTSREDGRLTMAEVSGVILANAVEKGVIDKMPEYRDMRAIAPPRVTVLPDETHGEFLQIKLEGAVTELQVRALLKEFGHFKSLQFIVPNHPANYDIQSILMEEFNMVPNGVDMAARHTLADGTKIDHPFSFRFQWAPSASVEISPYTVMSAKAYQEPVRDIVPKIIGLYDLLLEDGKERRFDKTSTMRPPTAPTSAMSDDSRDEKQEDQRRRQEQRH